MLIVALRDHPLSHLLILAQQMPILNHVAEDTTVAHETIEDMVGQILIEVMLPSTYDHHTVPPIPP